MAYCSRCGTLLITGDLFCTSCGHQVNQGNQPVAKEQNNQQSSYCFRLDCIEQKGSKFNYVYLIFYTDRVVIVYMSGNELERVINHNFRALRKEKKIKLSQFNSYRTEQLATYPNSLIGLKDDQILSMNQRNEVIYYNYISSARFQFMKKTTYHGAEDSHVSTTRGFMELSVGERILKFYHSYYDHQETRYLLHSVMGGRIQLFI